MGLGENIKLAISSLKASKLRSFLTMLGIIIGISSVITIVTIGDSLAKSINDEMSGFGARNINVYLEQKDMFEYDENGEMIYKDYVEQKPADYITYEMIKDYKESMGADILAVSVAENAGNSTISNGKNKADIDLYAVNADYFKTQNIEILAGRKLTDKDNEEVRSLAVVSDVFVDKYFGGEYTAEEALGKTFDVAIANNTVRLYICGVYIYNKEDGASVYGNKGDIPTKVYMPVSVYKQLSNEENAYNSLTVVPNGNVNMEDFLNKTNAYFEKAYKNNENQIAKAYSMESMMEATNKMINSIKLAISAVAGISLLVGGIGVMNIMMVSITERTKEIGIRKALGAGKNVILMQFIVEAIIICIIGGIIGVILGNTFGAIGARVMGYAAVINIKAIIFSVGFCMAIGIFFGYYPASKAAKMNPIDALRYE